MHVITTSNLMLTSEILDKFTAFVFWNFLNLHRFEDFVISKNERG